MSERIITIIQSTSALSGSLTPVFDLPLEKRPILLIQELVPGDGSEGLEEEGDWTQQRIYLVKAPDCPMPLWTFPPLSQQQFRRGQSIKEIAQSLYVQIIKMLHSHYAKQIWVPPWPQHLRVKVSEKQKAHREGQLWSARNRSSILHRATSCFSSRRH